MKLRKIYDELLNESIDLYSLEILKSKNINLLINRNRYDRFESNFVLNSIRYNLFIEPIDDVVPSIFFGDIKTDGLLNLYELNNKNYSAYVLGIVFSLLRLWVNQNDIKIFKYTLTDERRKKLYELFLRKYFNDFELIEIKEDNNHPNFYTFIWKKK